MKTKKVLTATIPDIAPALKTGVVNSAKVLAKGGAAWLDSLWVLWSMIAILVALFAPTVDGTLRPAVIEFSLDMKKSYVTSSSYVDEQGIAHEADLLVAYGDFNKQRCEFRGSYSVGYSKTRGEVRVDMDYRDRKNGAQTKNRPQGPQQFGPWFIFMEPKSDIWGVQPWALHLCGAGMFKWTIYTKLGPVISVDSFRRLDV